ncbi:MAG TPA: hypothetical protein VJ794_08620, partial [Gemmatimonadales bacterium]|nr:hypothetical protein [Gemmatimonadales bacterium]
ALSSEGSALELPASGEQLPPGRYTRHEFSPAVSFELHGPWFAVQSLDGFFDVQQDVGSPDVIAVQFARPDHVFGADGDRVRVDTAAEAAAAVAENPNLEILGQGPGRTGGHDGHVVEVEHPGAGAADVSVMRVPPGPLMISPDRRLWITFIDTSDGLLAILVGGSVARWEEALATAEPVLESVLIHD